MMNNVVLAPPPLFAPVKTFITKAAISKAKFAVKFTHQQITRLNFGAISNSDERPSGRDFFAFTFLGFFSFFSFLGTGAALAGFATATGLAFLISFSVDSTLSSNPIFSPHSCVHFGN